MRILTPLQRVGVEWLFGRCVADAENRGAILADETGVGKTLQTIALISALVESGGATRVMILAPASLRSTWRREVQKHLGDGENALNLVVVAEGDSYTNATTLMAQHGVCF